MRITQHPDGTITIDTGGIAAKQVAVSGDTVAGRIFKADAAQRKTWHVFYPADKADVAVAMDGHRDFAGKAAVEKAAHDYLLRHRKVGLLHADGTDGSGDLVESGIHHGPDWVMKAADDSEQRVLDGDWTGAIQWDVPTWERWEKGELRGVSPQGGAVRGTPAGDVLAGLRKGAAGAAEKGDVGITELVEFEVTRVDGVVSPANGFPVLMMKGLGDPDGVIKGARDCPKCSRNHDADFTGDSCESCGAKLPDTDAGAAKAADAVDCPTCKGDGKIMAGKRDCPDCDASGKVTPGKAKALAAKSIARAIIAAPLELAKAIGADGQVDEAPDVDLGNKILALLGEAMQAEAAEMAAGNAGEAGDIMELAAAAQAVRCWRDGEQAVSMGDVMPASMLAQSAMKGEWPDDIDTTGWPKADADFFELFKLLTLSKAKHSTADRKKLAEAGNALSDGSYPIADEHDLKSAAILAQSGHGDVDGAKRLIGRRAKELGVRNPLDDSGGDASKGQIAQEGADVDTVTKGSDDLSKTVADAVTKALAPLEGRLKEQGDLLKAAGERLAKVEALPQPGGPVMSVMPRRQREDDGIDHAAKAVEYEGLADKVTNPQLADDYRQLAARHRKALNAS